MKYHGPRVMLKHWVYIMGIILMKTLFGWTKQKRSETVLGSGKQEI